MKSIIELIAQGLKKILSYLGISAGINLSKNSIIVSVIITATVALYAVIQGLMQAMTYTIDSPLFTMYFWALYPDNASTCLAVILQIQVATFVYNLKVSSLDRLSRAGV
jgi:hypothetical protein